VRVLVSSDGTERGLSDELLSGLRRRGVACARSPNADAEAYARAWRYSHMVRFSASGVTAIEIETGQEERFSIGSMNELGASVASFVERSFKTREVR